MDNLLKRRMESFFRFFMYADVEPTNNWAGKNPRSSVIDRKISGGSRSERDEDINTKIYSAYYTSEIHH